MTETERNGNKEKFKSLFYQNYVVWFYIIGWTRTIASLHLCRKLVEKYSTNLKCKKYTRKKTFYVEIPLRRASSQTAGTK